MNKFAELEQKLIEKMTPQQKDVMSELSQKEKMSFEENVNLVNIETIQSWIGSKKEIEKMLFWDKGRKFDDQDWKELVPLNDTTKVLFEKAWDCYDRLKNEAVEIHMRSDLTLYSQFNPKLLFTGLAGAFRCNYRGKVDDNGNFYEGVEIRCIGSVGDYMNSVTIFPLNLREFEVHLGSRSEHGPEGIWVYTGDSYSLLQLDKLISKDYVKYGFNVGLRNSIGSDVTLDPKAIRRASKNGEGTGYDKELILFASIRVHDMGKALEAAETLSRCLSHRFGLELECYKIGKKYGNFFILRNDNFDDFLSKSPIPNKGLVFFTATFECRRCRRELETFQKIAKLYPDITFAIVNIATPQFKFYERVFGDMGGGDPNEFRHRAVGSTPFTIIYKPDKNGVLHFAEYHGTEKSEAAPSFEECVGLIEKHFSFTLRSDKISTQRNQL